MNTSTNKEGSAFFKQMDEKHVSLEVRFMLWNPRMDLIALAFVNADVHLYRMSWQRVWAMSNPHTSTNCSITSMAWRPDGKVLAIGYSNGHFRLVSVEDGSKKLFSFQFAEGVESLYWLQEDAQLSNRHQSLNFYEDVGARCLPRPVSYDLIYHLFDKQPNAQSTNANKDAFNKNKELENAPLTYLVCTHGSSVALFVYGHFLLADIVTTSATQKLKYANMAENCSILSLLSIEANSHLAYSLLDTSLLSRNHLQIKLITSKFSILFSMQQALKGVIKEMEELWEDILVEMDKKFQTYAQEKYSKKARDDNMEFKYGIESSLVHEFIQLYALGSCSNHFKTFLIHELTEKGLKKLEQSVENYYSNIQRLLSGNFHQISLCMFYHLNELNGMIKWFDKFTIFSLTEAQLEDLISGCGSLILKGQELNFVIEQNMKEIKLFFKWLHASIIHLTDDQAVTEMAKLNEEMENLILDFINNTFKDDQTINLEKVGQYLKHENLRIQVTEENDWHQFVKQKLPAKDLQQFFPLKREQSLIGCFNDFKLTLTECFRCQAINKNQSFPLLRKVNIHKLSQNYDSKDMIVSSKCFGDSMFTGVVLEKTNNSFNLIRNGLEKNSEVRSLSVSLLNPIIDLSQICFQDIYVYSKESITLMGTELKSKANTYMIQLNFDDMDEGASLVNEQMECSNSLTEDLKKESINASAVVKYLPDTKSVSLCVSSSRKVAALLSITRQRVKLFELEADPEENEDEEEGDGDEEFLDADNEQENMASETLDEKSSRKGSSIPLNPKTNELNIDPNETDRLRVKRKKEFDDEDDDDEDVDEQVDDELSQQPSLVA